jgi:hypothetical protein
MKVSLLAAVLVASLGALLVFTTSGSEVSRAQPDFGVQALPELENQAAPTRVWQCFDLQRGEDADTVVRLVTENFGGDRVQVRNLVMMCELALKYRPVPGTADPAPPPDEAVVILACYRIQEGGDPNDPFVLTTANFGSDGILVRNSNLMCEEASKTRVVVTPDGNEVRETTGQPTGQTWQCYRLSGGNNPQAPFRLLTNNFGRDDVRVMDSVLMCEGSAKFRQNSDGTITQFGDVTGQVVQCFRILEGGSPNLQVTLDTENFGQDEVAVRRSSLMCEPARKQPVFIAGVAILGDAP